MFRKLLETEGRYSLLVLRLGLAAVMFPHGAQKALGWFGGPGFAGSLKFFTETMQVPVVLAYLVIAAEALGSLGLVLGLFTRVAALGIGAVMAGAVVMVHMPNGFFMNWSNVASAGEGFEYHILAFTMALVLMLAGGGSWSLDRAFCRPSLPSMPSMP